MELPSSALAVRCCFRQWAWAAHMGKLGNHIWPPIEFPSSCTGHRHLTPHSQTVGRPEKHRRHNGPRGSTNCGANLKMGLVSLLMPQGNLSPGEGGDTVAEAHAPRPSSVELAPILPHYYPLTGEIPPPPPPQRDPNCKLCQTPSTPPCFFDPGKGRYEQGEILQIEESAHTPIDRLFSRITEGAQADLSPRPGMSSVRFYQDFDRRPRPGMAMEARRVALTKENTYICIMATYRGIHSFAFLPPVLKHFCLPISPHCEIDKDVAHLHTSPEWQRRHTWVIARAFFSKGKVLGRWQWLDENYTRTADRSFKIDRQTIDQFWLIEQQKWEKWEEQAADAGYLQARYVEYNVSQ